MKTLVIDSSPSITRWAVEDGDAPKLHESFALWGRRTALHPDRIWTDGRERVTAFEDEVLSVATLWERLLKKTTNSERHEDAKLLVAAVFAEIQDVRKLDRVVFTIPEALPETSQNALITALSIRCRVSRCETYLLWRSVALALSACGDPDLEAGVKSIILDYGHLIAEFSALQMIDREGHLCPLRDFTSNRSYGRLDSDSLKQWILRNYVNQGAECLSKEDSFRAKAYNKLQKDLNFDPPSGWICASVYYEKVEPSHDEFAKPVPWEVVKVGVDEYVDKCLEAETPGQEDPMVRVWHGWPPYWHGERSIKSHYRPSILTEPNAGLMGGIEFAGRHRLGQPTYLEQIPDYAIWCEVYELGIRREWRWEPLIKSDKILGTKNHEAEPNTRFELMPETLSFDMSVREGRKPTYRFVEQTMPVAIEKNTPITIHSEIRPTGGGVKFSLRAPDEPNLFGQNAELALKVGSCG